MASRRVHFAEGSDIRLDRPYTPDGPDGPTLVRLGDSKKNVADGFYYAGDYRRGLGQFLSNVYGANRQSNEVNRQGRLGSSNVYSSSGASSNGLDESKIFPSAPSLSFAKALAREADSLADEEYDTDEEAENKAIQDAADLRAELNAKKALLARAAATKARNALLRQRIPISSSKETDWRHHSKLGVLHYNIVSVTAEAINHGVRHIQSASTRSYWSVATGVNHEIVLEVKDAALLGYVQIHNHRCSAIELAVSFVDNRRDSYVTVRSDDRMPHDKSITYNISFLPSRFLRLRVLRGLPVSIYSVKIFGIPLVNAGEVLGPELYELLVRKPRRSLMIPPQPKIRADTRHEQYQYPLAQVVRERPKGQTERWEQDPRTHTVCLP